MSLSEREQGKKLSKVTLKDTEIGKKTFITVRVMPASQGLSELIQCVPEMPSHVADVLMSNETLCMLHGHEVSSRQTAKEIVRSNRTWDNLPADNASTVWANSQDGVVTFYHAGKCC